MKTPLYAVAAVGLGVAGFLAYQKVEVHEQKLSDTIQLEKQTVRVKSTIAANQKKYDPLVKTNAELTESLSVAKAELEMKQNEGNQLAAQVSQIENSVKTKQEELQQLKDRLTEVEAAFAAQNVPVSGILDYLKQLEEEKEALLSESEELAAVVAATEAKLEASKKQLSDYNQREVERARNLSQNAIASTITAVNSDWGFVVITPHPGAVITADSKLIVVRGGKHLGRLKINAVEPNRVIADIDYDSLVAGSRVRAGDRVILAKTNTH